MQKTVIGSAMLLVMAAGVILFFASQNSATLVLGDNKLSDAYSGIGLKPNTAPGEAATLISTGEIQTAEHVVAQYSPEKLDISVFEASVSEVLEPSEDGNLAGAPVQPASEIAVTFELSELTKRQLGEPRWGEIYDTREIGEQLRDWMLFAAADRHAKSPDALRQILFDFPAVRYGHMLKVSKFQYGSLRVLPLGDATGMALVPNSYDEAQTIDAIAEAADRLRTDLGRMPDRVQIYRYDFADDLQTGTLTDAGSVSGSKIFSSAYGYVTRKITSAEDLKNFIADTDDVVFASADWTSVTLGGRKLQSQPFQSVTFEHIATLYQSEADISRRTADFDRWADALQKKLTREMNNTGGSQSVYQARYDRELAEEWFSLGIPSGSGFSLDSTFHVERILEGLSELSGTSFRVETLGNRGLNDGSGRGISDSLVAAVEKVCPRLEDSTQTSLVSNWEMSETSDDVTRVRMRNAIDPIIEDIRDNKAALGAEDRAGTRASELIAPIFKLRHELRAENDARYRLLSCLLDDHQFQFARYDGPLNGTEVGMVLFYTDLLAKIWTIEFNGASPSQGVPDFVTDFSRGLSPIYEAESYELNYARLWFGHDNAAFGLVRESAGDALAMRRIATRIYSAGSNPINPGVESQTSRRFAGSTDWWNDHYAEVAAYEPQYQILNGIMKWSLIIGWLNEEGKGNRLSFLADMQVDRDNWFPDWAQANKNLKFDAWGKVDFFERGFLGKTTETMTRLSGSGRDPFSAWQMSGVTGGVSLAPRRVFRERIRPKSFQGPSRRAFLDYSRSKAKISLTALDGTEYTFSKAINSVVAKAVPNTRRQGIGAEFHNRNLTRTFERNSDGSSIGLTLGQQPVGQLTSKATGENAITIGFRSRALDLAQQSVREASRDIGALSARVAVQPEFSAVIEVASSTGTRQLFAQIGRGKAWFEIASDAPANTTVAANWTGRAADVLAREGLQFRPARLPDILSKSTNADILLKPTSGRPVLTLAENAARQPGQRITLVLEGQSIPARVTKNGTISINRTDLPIELKSNPDRFASLAPEIFKRLDDGQTSIVLRQPAAAEDLSLVHSALATGDRSFLVKAFANNPTRGQAAMQEVSTDVITRSKHLIRSGDPTRALAELETLSKLAPRSADVVFGKVLAQLDLGRMRQAVNTMNTSPRLRPERVSFIDEVAVRMGGGRPPEPPIVGPARSGSGRGAGGNEYIYDRLLKVADFKRRPRRTDDVADMRLRLLPNEVALEARLSQTALQNAPKATSKELESAVKSAASGRVKIDIYVPETGRYGVGNFAEGRIADVLAPVVQGQSGSAVRLPLGSAAAYRPSVIMDPSTGIKYVRVTRMPHTAITTDGPTILALARGTPRQSMLPLTWALQSVDCASEDENDENCDDTETTSLQIPNDVLIIKNN